MSVVYARQSVVLDTTLASSVSFPVLWDGFPLSSHQDQLPDKDPTYFTSFSAHLKHSEVWESQGW